MGARLGPFCNEIVKKLDPSAFLYRPGARGGRDQFNWENVKSDKDREFYLGHSVKASTGRWQKGKLGRLSLNFIDATPSLTSLRLFTSTIWRPNPFHRVASDCYELMQSARMSVICSAQGRTLVWHPTSKFVPHMTLPSNGHSKPIIEDRTFKFMRVRLFLCYILKLHSLVVSGKDIFWYAREKQDDKEQAIRDEVSMVKAREEELMLEVLCLRLWIVSTCQHELLMLMDSSTKPCMSSLQYILRLCQD